MMASAPSPYVPLEEDTAGLYAANRQQIDYYAPQEATAVAASYYPPTAGPIQQPLSQQLIINQPAPVVVQPVRRIQSFAGHIILACCVFCCCGCVFGLIAFILAGMYVCQVCRRCRDYIESL